MMTAREAIAALMSATEAAGYDGGDSVMHLATSGSITYRRVGAAIHVQFSPAVEVARSGLVGAVANGEIRRAEITHEGVRVWIEGVPIIGTIERQYDA